MCFTLTYHTFLVQKILLKRVLCNKNNFYKTWDNRKKFAKL
jgi:hypothetical protein